MCHDLTTSLTCFRTGWQSGFGWYGIFQARTEELILIVPFCGMMIGRPTDHWGFWPHLAVCDCRWWGWSQSEASACLPGVAGVQNKKTAQLSDLELKDAEDATWAQDLHIELLFSSSWNWGISWWLPNLGSKVPCNPWSQIGHDMFPVMHKVIVSKYLQVV